MLPSLSAGDGAFGCGKEHVRCDVHICLSPLLFTPGGCGVVVFKNQACVISHGKGVYPSLTTRVGYDTVRRGRFPVNTRVRVVFDSDGGDDDGDGDDG